MVIKLFFFPWKSLITYPIPTPRANDLKRNYSVCFFLILTNFLTKETGNPPLTCIIYCLLKKKTNKQTTTTTTTKTTKTNGWEEENTLYTVFINHSLYVYYNTYLQYLKRSLRGILLLKTKGFEKMYSKKTDARGILPNTFRLLRKNYYYYPLRI